MRTYVHRFYGSMNDNSIKVAIKISHMISMAHTYRSVDIRSKYQRQSCNNNNNYYYYVSMFCSDTTRSYSTRVFTRAMNQTSSHSSCFYYFALLNYLLGLISPPLGTEYHGHCKKKNNNRQLVTWLIGTFNDWCTESIVFNIQHS